MCTPQLDRSEMFMELYREEKREEGDRGGQEDKRALQGPCGRSERVVLKHVYYRM